MLLFAAGSLVLAGCSDDNPTDPIPEDADDNFITSVVLTVGDTPMPRRSRAMTLP